MLGNRGRVWRKRDMALWKVGTVIWDFGLGRRIDVSLEKVDFDDAGKGSSLALKCRRQTVSLFVLVETNGSLQ
jgi:hypothetical protein